MKNHLLNFALICLSSTVLPQVGYSQQDDISDWQPKLQRLEKYKNYFAVALTPEDRKKMETLWNEIGDDLQTEENNFAGTYVESGYENGYLLRWSTKKGFVLISYSDQDKIVDFSYGNVEITKDSEVILSPQKEMQGNRRGFLKTPLIWIPVKNSEFLVYKEKIASFGDYYGGFGQFNGFPRKVLCDGCGHFARRFDEKKNNTDISFIAPPKYLKFIKKPISGQITRIGKRWKTKNTTASCCQFETDVSALPVSINVGREHGVTRSLLFLLINAGDNFDQILKITRVNEKTSEGIVFRVLDKNGKENYNGEIYDHKSESYNQIPFPPIRIGTKITTSQIVQ